MYQEFEKSKLPPAVIDCLDGDPDKEFELIKCVMPNEIYDNRKMDDFPFSSYDI